MNHSVDQTGTINLIPSIEEIDILSSALASKNVQLRRVNVSPDTCDQILSMLATLNAARSESRRKIAKADSLKSNSSTPKRNIWSRLFDFFNPPFTITDFDNAESFCGSEIFLTSMDFHPDKTGYPFNVAGYALFNGVWIDCTWNAWGKCHCPLLGSESYLFNLVRPSKIKEVNNSRSNTELATLGIQ